MRAKDFAGKISELGISNMIGVPDSALKPFCNYLNSTEQNEFKHYVPVNEGAAVGFAMGTYLATGRPACIYMQNSGIGNTVNPITSLANEEVYDIPMLLIVGWRGEPEKKDEPQHKFMGKITEDILEVIGIEHCVLDASMTETDIDSCFTKAKKQLGANRQFAFVIKKGFFDEDKMEAYYNNYKLVREEVIGEVLQRVEDEDVIISTTGKISREVYEQSEKLKGQHAQCFLTVGGMGHASMIALGMAKERADKRVYCLDGDGATLMHMGNLAFIAKQNPDNLVHICLNNEAHESVGGMPTGSVGTDYAEVARASGYSIVYTVRDGKELNEALTFVERNKQLTFIEVKVKLQSRDDLGRPKESAKENKIKFMKYHEG